MSIPITVLQILILYVNNKDAPCNSMDFVTYADHYDRQKLTTN